MQCRDMQRMSRHCSHCEYISLCMMCFKIVRQVLQSFVYVSLTGKIKFGQLVISIDMTSLIRFHPFATGMCQVFNITLHKISFYVFSFFQISSVQCGKKSWQLHAVSSSFPKAAPTLTTPFWTASTRCHVRTAVAIVSTLIRLQMTLTIVLLLVPRTLMMLTTVVEQGVA